jgi:hypothetical protein
MRLLIAAGVLAVCAAITGTVAHKQAGQTGLPLTASQIGVLNDSIALMRKDDLGDQADLAVKLLAKGIWRLASPDDRYMADAERQGDTPFAYTLSAGHQPSAIVLAPRFFTETDGPTDRAALMVHEMGHYQAYVATGRSTEYDGYKAEYDANAKLGLTGGLIYFAMLDGVSEYVVPIDPSYAKKKDVADYMKSPG